MEQVNQTIWATMAERLERVGLRLASLVRLQDNPFFLRDFRRQMRGRWALAGLLIPALILAAFPLVTLLVSELFPLGGRRTALSCPSRAMTFWSGTLLAQLILVLSGRFGAVIPAITEYFQKTLEPLLVTPLSGVEMVLKRGAFAVLLGLWASLLVLPFHLFCLGAGGPTAWEVVSAYILSTALALACVVSPGEQLTSELPAKAVKWLSRWGQRMMKPGRGRPYLGLSLLRLVPAVIYFEWMFHMFPFGASRGPLVAGAMIWIAGRQPFFGLQLRPLWAIVALVIAYAAVQVREVAASRVPAQPFRGRWLRAGIGAYLLFICMGFAWDLLVRRGLGGTLVAGSTAMRASLGGVFILFIVAWMLGEFASALLEMARRSSETELRVRCPGYLLGLDVLVASLVPVALVGLGCILSGISPAAIPLSQLGRGTCCLAGALVFLACLRWLAGQDSPHDPRGRWFRVASTVGALIFLLGYAFMFLPRVWHPAFLVSPPVSWLTLLSPNSRIMTLMRGYKPITPAAWWLGPLIQAAVGLGVVLLSRGLAGRRQVVRAAAALPTLAPPRPIPALRGHTIRPASEDLRERFVALLWRICPNPVAVLEMRRVWAYHRVLLVLAPLGYLIAAIVAVRWCDSITGSPSAFFEKLPPGPLSAFAVLTYAGAFLLLGMVLFWGLGSSIAMQRASGALEGLLVTPLRDQEILAGATAGHAFVPAVLSVPVIPVVLVAWFGSSAVLALGALVAVFSSTLAAAAVGTYQGVRGGVLAPMAAPLTGIVVSLAAVAGWMKLPIAMVAFGVRGFWISAGLVAAIWVGLDLIVLAATLPPTFRRFRKFREEGCLPPAVRQEAA